MKYRGQHIPVPQPPKDFPTAVPVDVGHLTPKAVKTQWALSRPALAIGCAYLDTLSAQWRHTEEAWTLVFLLLYDLEHSNQQRLKHVRKLQSLKEAMQQLRRQRDGMKAAVGKSIATLKSLPTRDDSTWEPETEDARAQVAQLVSLVSTPEENGARGAYHDGELATLLGVTPREVTLMKCSKAFKRAMLEILEANAMIHAVSALPMQAQIASTPTNKQAATAFKNVAMVAGAMKQRSVVENTGKVNHVHSIEGMLDKLRGQRPGVIDVGEK